MGQPLITQPYPLYYGSVHDGKLETGRIVGWHQAGGGGLDTLQPIVLFDAPDGTVGRLGYVELDSGEDVWVGDSLNEIFAAMESTASFRQEKKTGGRL